MYQQSAYDSEDRIGVKLVILSILPIALITFGVITRFEIQQGWLFARTLFARTVRPADGLQ